MVLKALDSIFSKFTPYFKDIINNDYKNILMNYKLCGNYNILILYLRTIIFDLFLLKFLTRIEYYLNLINFNNHILTMKSLIGVKFYKTVEKG